MKTRNPAFSMRAFARSLGISTTALADVVTGKRNFSRQNAEKVASRLGFTPSEFNAMLYEISGRPDYKEEERLLLEIEEDRFKAIAEWYHLAILSFARIPKCTADLEVIASRLGITKLEAREAVCRLQRLRLLENRDGVLVRTAAPITTSRDRPSVSLRKFNGQMLRKALESLESTPVSVRDIGSVTMAIDTNKLNEAKELIQKFKMDLVRLMETPTPNAVYTLGVQFFPLTVTEKTDE